MIVVAIIGVLAAMAFISANRVRNRALAARFASDLQKYQTAFEQYYFQNGAWPAAAAAGNIPAGMEGALPANYVMPSPMGGGYSWSGDTGRIRLTSSSASDDMMQLVDAMIDDGDLTTGAFRSMTSGGYHLQL